MEIGFSFYTLNGKNDEFIKNVKKFSSLLSLVLGQLSSNVLSHLWESYLFCLACRRLSIEYYAEIKIE